jgi:8-oxo-dGTP pyrophosphatase MutT (NUDIX family)
MKKVLAAGGLVFNEQHDLLMIYRFGKWDLPKGHVEKGETMENCALREVREETGIGGLSISHFVGVTEHEYYDNKLNADAIKEVHWFAMRSSAIGDLFPQLQEGIEWLRWVSPPELETYLYNSYSNIREIVSKARKPGT